MQRTNLAKEPNSNKNSSRKASCQMVKSKVQQHKQKEKTCYSPHFVHAFSFVKIVYKTWFNSSLSSIHWELLKLVPDFNYIYEFNFENFNHQKFLTNLKCFNCSKFKFRFYGGKQVNSVNKENILNIHIVHVLNILTFSATFLTFDGNLSMLIRRPRRADESQVWSNPV